MGKEAGGYTIRFHYKYVWHYQIKNIETDLEESLITILLVFEGENRTGKVENPNREMEMEKGDGEEREKSMPFCNEGWQAPWWKGMALQRKTEEAQRTREIMLMLWPGSERRGRKWRRKRYILESRTPESRQA